MDALEYNIVLKTPLGYRVGRIIVEIKDRLMQGVIHILGKEESYQGCVDDNGNFAIKGKLPTQTENIPFEGNGKISCYAIHITIPSDDFTYELDGTSRK